MGVGYGRPPRSRGGELEHGWAMSLKSPSDLLLTDGLFPEGPTASPNSAISWEISSGKTQECVCVCLCVVGGYFESKPQQAGSPTPIPFSPCLAVCLYPQS